MTLIVCLKAKDCIVIAADSLTSLGGKVVSCTTEKLHQVGTDAVTAGCGLSRVQGLGWRAILAGFSAPPPGAAFAVTVSQLQAFLDGIIGKVPRGNVGACQGGNTFLLAGHDAANLGTAVARLTRLGDRRQFEPVRMDSHASSPNYIEWIGDTTPVMCSEPQSSGSRIAIIGGSCPESLQRVRGVRPTITARGRIKPAIGIAIVGAAPTLIARDGEPGRARKRPVFCLLAKRTRNGLAAPDIGHRTR